MSLQNFRRCIPVFQFFLNQYTGWPKKFRKKATENTMCCFCRNITQYWSDIRSISVWGKNNFKTVVTGNWHVAVICTLSKKEKKTLLLILYKETFVQQLQEANCVHFCNCFLQRRVEVSLIHCIIDKA